VEKLRLDPARRIHILKDNGAADRQRRDILAHQRAARQHARLDALSTLRAAWLAGSARRRDAGAPAAREPAVADDEPPPPDLADVRGQPMARTALAVAAAGGHHLLLVGPPGSGKTMLAQRLPAIFDTAKLAALADAAGLDGKQLVAASQTDGVAADYARFTDEAIAANVFGIPWYRIDGQNFWGQDRLDFVERALMA
jgi:hypothetical protein